MVLVDPVLGARLVFVLGLFNIIGLFLIFFSCRCLAGRKLSQKLMKHDWFKRFYGFHCYYWWFFFVSVLLHSILALLVFFF
jgi:hypothetical protein